MEGVVTNAIAESESNRQVWCDSVPNVDSVDTATASRLQCRTIYICTRRLVSDRPFAVRILVETERKSSTSACALGCNKNKTRVRKERVR